MENKGKKQVLNLTLAAMFLAIGLVLPFLTGQLKQFGSALLPMHIPVILCGLICGWQYGLGVGLVLPLLRSALFGMPVLLTAAAMSFELAAYGFAAGFLYFHSRWKCVVALYRSLIIAMLAGRVVWGIAQVVLLNLLGLGENGFTLQMFMAGAFLNAVPGIIIQLILIPAIMIALNRTGLVRFSNNKAKTENSES
ncbi:MAG: ECF transporter S component [Ruminococcus sp.]|nr:ECF transporter S component [Ruminococcus sp.]MCM1478965.1 ECF transporter S component [Muribaculaceae bacterium]